jgi:hypothetical protein
MDNRFKGKYRSARSECLPVRGWVCPVCGSPSERWHCSEACKRVTVERVIAGLASVLIEAAPGKASGFKLH